MSCSMPISCSASAAGSNCLGLPPRPIPSIIGPTRAAGVSSGIFGSWYAQSHPDEDFAETFAVWLTPRSNWRKRYADWPALKKLEYVDELMAEIGRQKPVLNRRLEVDPIRPPDRYPCPTLPEEAGSLSR